MLCFNVKGMIPLSQLIIRSRGITLISGGTRGHTKEVHYPIQINQVVSQFLRPKLGQYQNQQAFVNPHSTLSSSNSSFTSQSFVNPSIPPPRFDDKQEKKLINLEKTFNSFMQTATQMLNFNHQANNTTQQTITRLELQIIQMVTQIGEREGNILE